MKKDWLTPEELAQATGFSRQTINKWVKRENWITIAKPGVQGGKARLIKIDERVTSYLDAAVQATEPTPAYVTQSGTLQNILLNSIMQMSSRERDQLSALLLREGIKGVLQRLGIDDS